MDSKEGEEEKRKFISESQLKFNYFVFGDKISVARPGLKPAKQAVECGPTPAFKWGPVAH